MRPPDFPGNQRRGGVVYPCVPEGNSQQHGSEIGAAVRLGLSGMNPRHRRPRARGFEGVGQYWPYTTKPAGPSPKPSSSNISQSMRSNKSRGTWPEILLSKHLRKRLVGNDLPGRPDFVYRDARSPSLFTGASGTGAPPMALSFQRPTSLSGRGNSRGTWNGTGLTEKSLKPWAGLSSSSGSTKSEKTQDVVLDASRQRLRDYDEPMLSEGG